MQASLEGSFFCGCGEKGHKESGRSRVALVWRLDCCNKVQLCSHYLLRGWG